MNITRLQDAGTGLTLTWDDNLVATVPWATLRRDCPCAVCETKRNAPPAPVSIGKFGGLNVLTKAEAQPIRPTKMHAVGNYAYSIHFNDGHEAGIFPIELLRSMSERVASERTGGAKP